MSSCLVGELLKGEVLGSKRINNLIVELVRTHKKEVEIDDLQSCEHEVYGTDGSTGQVVTMFFLFSLILINK